MPVADDSDWRLQGQESYLKGVTLVRRAWRVPTSNPAWDHDHCEFCWAKFMDADSPHVMREGHATGDA
jgi:hypothetical protein